MAVFVTAVTYFGAELIGTFIVESLAIEGLSAVAVSAIGAGTISATATAIQGGSVGDIFKSAVLGGVTSYVGGSIGKEISSVVRADAIMNGNLSFDAANSIGKIAGSVGTGGVNSATRAIAAGKDPIDALIKGGLTAGLSAGVGEGVNYTTSQIPGFDNLAKDYGGVGEAAQRAIKTGLTTGLLGKNVGDAVLNSVIGSATRAGGDLVKDLTSDLRTAYNNATSTGSTLDENYLQQKQIVQDYNSTAAEVEAKRQGIQDNLDKYNKAKEELDALPSHGGFSSISARVVKLSEVNQYATLVNDEFPDFEKQRAEAQAKVADLSTKLDELKTAADPLQKTLADQIAVLQTNKQNFLTQEEINAQNIAKAVADATAAQTGDTTNVVTPVNTTTTETLPTTVTQPTTVTEPTTATQPTGAAAISAQDIRDFVAIHSEEEIKAAMARTGVTQAQVDAALAPVTTTAPVTLPVTTEAPVTSPVTTAPVTVTTEAPVTTTNTGPSAEVIRNFVATHTPEEVQAAMIANNVSQAQVDAAMNSAVAPVVNPPPVVQPVVNTVVAPPPVVAPVVQPPVVDTPVAPVVAPPPVAPVINPPPVVSPPPVVAPPVIEQPPIVPPPVVAPPVQPPVVETPVVEQPVTTPLVVPPAETAADLEKVFPKVAERPVLPTGGLETIASNLQDPIAVPTTTNPATETPGGLNAVSGNLVDTGSGLQMPDFSKTLGSMATKFLQSKLTPAKRPTTSPKPSSVPRLASKPVGGLSAVKAPVKAAAARRVDVSKLIPVQKAVAPPKTLPSNAKLTPIRNVANLTSLVKKVG